MQRIQIVNFDQQSTEKNHLLDQYNEFRQLLENSVSTRTLSVLPIPQKINNTNQLAWFTRLEGQAMPLDQLTNEIEQDKIKAILAKRLNDIDASIKTLLASASLNTTQKDLLTEWSLRIIATNPILVINEDPVILYDFEKALKASPPPPPPPPPPLPKPKRFFRWWQLLMLVLLLLGLLWLLGYLFCPLYPKNSLTTIPTEPPVQQVETEQEPSVSPPEITNQPEPELPLPTTKEEPLPTPEVEKQPTPTPEEKQQPTPPATKPKNVTNCVMPKKQPLNHPQKPSRIVIIFDNSYSMLLTLMETPEEINRFLNMNYFTMTNKQINDYHQRMYRLPSRLSGSKQAALSSIDKIQPNIDIGLVVLESCPMAKNFGFFNNRTKLKNIITQLQPLERNSATPLYSGLQNASQLLDGVNSDDYILLISDGEDSCTKSNICTLAQSIAMKKPRLQINIIDLAGLHNIDCVANATGGKVYIAQNNKDLIDQMNKVMNKMDISKPICKE